MRLFTFTHLKFIDTNHLNSRHKKYHLKPFKCAMPSCAVQNVAFSLAKDLLRHQKSHAYVRYFCDHVGCFAAVGGKFTGFAREDNWRRHLKMQHSWASGRWIWTSNNGLINFCVFIFLLFHLFFLGIIGSLGCYRKRSPFHCFFCTLGKDCDLPQSGLTRQARQYVGL